MEFFHSCAKTETFGEAVTRFKAAGLKMNLARSATVGVLIPTKHMMRDVENNRFSTFEEEETCVGDCRVLYECMYHREDQLDAEYGETTLEDKLDTMESFVRVIPMPIKSGEMVFLCNCSEAYKNYACVHSEVLSMLWNEDMKFPDTERAHHLKAKLTKKSLSPFEAVAKRKHLDKDKISDSSRQADPKVIGKPVLPTYTPPLEDSGASMAVKGKSMEPAVVLHSLRR